MSRAKARDHEIAARQLQRDVSRQSLRQGQYRWIQSMYTRGFSSLMVWLSEEYSGAPRNCRVRSEFLDDGLKATRT